MSPGTRERRPAAHGAPHNLDNLDTATKRSRPDRTGLRRVLAAVYPPSGRRAYAALVVRNCPFCVVGGHLHRGAGGVRRAGCGRGQYYLVARPALVGGAA